MPSRKTAGRMKGTEKELSTGLKVVFVSNYLNHHQIPFCRAMYKRTEGSFAFLQTEPMEEERLRMGWNDKVEEPYLKLFYREPEECSGLIRDAETVIFGGTDDESYIQERLKSGKLILRYSERIYKTGQWKAVSPRGLHRKYLDHTRYRNSEVYLLCAGAYVPSDFHIVGAYPNKMFCWGYFPEKKCYDLDKLMAEKGWEGKTYLLWSGRMIGWKHPELALETARYLKEKGLSFHLDMIGGGELEEKLKTLTEQYGLQQEVSFPGFMAPEEVRRHMERADIYLLTSDRQEGWGAVANESMNSGCALVADHMVGAAPYLIRQGINGFAYRDGDHKMLFETVEALARDPEKRKALGRAAYETITTQWNAETAAKRLCALIERLRSGKETSELSDSGVDGFLPCQSAPVISERKMFQYLNRRL